MSVLTPWGILSIVLHPVSSLSPFSLKLSLKTQWLTTVSLAGPMVLELQ